MYSSSNRARVVAFTLMSLSTFTERASAFDQSPAAAGDERPPGVSAEEVETLTEIGMRFKQAKLGNRDEQQDAYNVFDSRVRKLSGNEAKAIAWELRAAFARSIGDREEAIRCSLYIVQELKETSRCATATDDLIDAYQNQGRYADMLQVASDAANSTTDGNRVVRLTSRMVHALCALGKARDAVDLLTEQLDEYPEHADLVLASASNASMLASVREEYPLALEAIQLVYSHTPKDQRSVALLANMAAAARSAGQAVDAIRYHREAIEQYPNDERVIERLFQVGVLSFELGDFGAAAEDFQAVIDIKSSFVEAPKLKRLAVANLQACKQRIEDAKKVRNSSLAEGSAANPWFVGANILGIFVICGVIAVKARRRAKE